VHIDGAHVLRQLGGTQTANPLLEGQELIHELHAAEELFLVGRLEDVGGGQLQELDAQLAPLLCVVGEGGQLVVLVHRHHCLHVLLGNELGVQEG